MIINLTMFLVFLTGCSSLSNPKKNMYEQGYRQAVQENFKQIADEFQGGDFPYYHWASPIVQQVLIPAHLGNGVMIPEHTELVIIKPGQWTMSQAYPIQTQKRKDYDNQISYVDMDVADLTALPNTMGEPKAPDTGREVQDHSTGMEEAAE